MNRIIDIPLYPTLDILDFLVEEELDKILYYFKTYGIELIEGFDTRHRKEYRLDYHEAIISVNNILMPKLEKIFPNKNLTIYNFRISKAIVPFNIHIDIDNYNNINLIAKKQNKKQYYSVMVPLDEDYHGSASTIYTNQGINVSLHSETNNLSNISPYGPYCVDNNVPKLPPDHQIPKEIIEKYLTHWVQKNALFLEYLSLEKVVVWQKKGQLIAHDCSRFHGAGFHLSRNNYLPSKSFFFFFLYADLND